MILFHRHKQYFNGLLKAEQNMHLVGIVVKVSFQISGFTSRQLQGSSTNKRSFKVGFQLSAVNMILFHRHKQYFNGLLKAEQVKNMHLVGIVVKVSFQISGFTSRQLQGSSTNKRSFKVGFQLSAVNMILFHRHKQYFNGLLKAEQVKNMHLVGIVVKVSFQISGFTSRQLQGSSTNKRSFKVGFQLSAVNMILFHRHKQYFNGLLKAEQVKNMHLVGIVVKVSFQISGFTSRQLQGSSTNKRSFKVGFQLSAVNMILFHRHKQYFNGLLKAEQVKNMHLVGIVVKVSFQISGFTSRQLQGSSTNKRSFKVGFQLSAVNMILFHRHKQYFNGLLKAEQVKVRKNIPEYSY
ncbi:uncharacterized protein LOC142318363 isoform X2 [Lycorma delicatula]|uniref:uncharacterized protein LOC142318363 isoform X2 n=1 Tax=Lycorma delicatula TaxID=130591 RepID=UPI003F516A65